MFRRSTISLIPYDIAEWRKCSYAGLGFQYNKIRNVIALLENIKIMCTFSRAVISGN